MMTTLKTHARILAGTLLVAACTGAVGASIARSDIVQQGGEICVLSNGIPDHETGTFPNAGNPHSISVQDHEYCVDATPTRGTTAQQSGGTVGIALNGIPIRPGTADWYDASSPRGHSRDRSSGWNLEGMGSADLLGIDAAGAHVDNQGIYHYHGPSDVLMAGMDGTHLGYAADGFEIHYVSSAMTSSWQLKSGTRPSEPFGAYDGSYVEDWEYVSGSGDLDQCNGGYLNGEFVYFATDTYPFFPRCFWGEISTNFAQGGGGAAAVGLQPGQPPRGPAPRRL
ncbi:YHYH protein [Pontivivens insulae]|uniref:YHYH domain-containing protein n=1 Tax=Pontivivens insulae TaxID=1639689 RepID=A0A2R8AC03_9RHOB|nr:YHYH protein [Pontivivens insulae]RED11069.1 YHYH protein [Pontivivens insulae]SPF29756.1 hypothetical protein POI8812_02073 [Pontivivens insulae]